MLNALQVNSRSNPTSTEDATTLAHLVSQIATDGNRAAFRELFEVFAPRIKTLMLRRGLDQRGAEDIAQETLLTVWRKAHLFRAERGSVFAWVFVIARNLQIDRLRRAGRNPVGLDEAPEPVDDNPTPLDAAVRYQQDERMRDALSTLPAPQREVIELAFYSGLPHTEIATRLALPLGTIKSRIRLAFDRLRPRLFGTYYG